MNAAAPPVPPASGSAGVARWHRPPFIGLLALFVAFLGTPLSHSLSVLASRAAGREHSFWVLFPLGCLALAVQQLDRPNCRQSFRKAAMDFGIGPAELFADRLGAAPKARIGQQH